VRLGGHVAEIGHITYKHVAGHANYLLELRKLLSVELITRELIEGIDDHINQNPVPEMEETPVGADA
jgi:hypothetical protein